MDRTISLNIFTDGGSRGNPGLAALGVYVENQNNEKLAAIGKTLGVATNNVAEYSAIVEGLNWILFNKKNMTKLSRINFYMDSQLAVRQLNGIYKIKSPHLRELLFSAKQKEAEIGLPIHYSHVPRDQNKKADTLVNMALDNTLQLP